MIRALTVSCALVVASLPLSAIASTVPVVYASNPAGVCQGALPQFAGTLRARPLAIVNEGESTAFVTCALPHAEITAATGNEVAETASEVTLTVANTGTGNLTVSCSMVSGNGFGSSNSRSSTKSRQLGSNGSFELTWTSADVSNTAIVAPNFSCQLPPGAAITRVSKTFLRNVGF